MTKPATVEEYIATFPPAIQKVLQEVRQVIREAAPEATETISYAIPTLQLGGKNLVHFAAFTDHIGFYGTPDTHAEFADDLARYHVGKGSVQFPLDQPMPLGLIKQMVHYRVQELSKH